MMFSGTVTMLCIFAALICASVRAITVDITPKNEVLVKEGDSLIILCNAGVPIRLCSVIVPSLKGTRYLQENKPKKDGLSYSGAGFNKGQCGVEIEHVKKEDDGVFKCNLLLSNEDTDFSATTKIIIARKPQNPELIVLGPGQNGLNSYTANDKIDIICLAASGRPPANLSLYIDDELIPTNYNGNDAIAEAEASRNLEWTDNGRTLRCVSNHLTLDKQGISVTRQLNVQYAPRTQDPIGFYNIMMGQERYINVTVNANPQPVFTWIIGNQHIIAGKSDDNNRIQTDPPKNLGNGLYLLNLKLVTVEKEDIEKTFVLEANNSLGREKYTVTLSGSEAPQVKVDIIPKNDVLVKEGDSLNIICNAGQEIQSCQVRIPSVGFITLSSTTPEKNGIKYHGAGFESGECGVRMKNVPLEYEGEFQCFVGISNHQGLESAKTNIFVTAKVDITPKNDILVEEGDSLDIMCKASREIQSCEVSIPSVGFTTLISTTSEKNGIKYHGAGVENRQCGVRIKNVSLQHEGEFECRMRISSQQKLSSAKAYIFVREKKRKGNRGPNRWVRIEEDL